MKKTIKKLPKRVVSIFLIMAIVFQYFTPYLEVLAEASTTTLQIDFRDSYDEGQGYVEYSTDDGEHWNSVTEDKTINNLNVTANNLRVRLVANEGYTYQTDGMEYSETINSEINRYDLSKQENGPIFGGLTGQNGYWASATATIVALVNIEFMANQPANQNPGQGNNPQPGQGEGEEAHFDGKAYILWSCGSGVCYHYFDNIPSFDDGNSKFYKDTEVTADNKTGETFNINAKYRGWYLKDTFEKWVADYELATGNAVDWNTLDPEVILGEPEQNVGQYEAGAIADGCTKPQQDAHWSEWNTFESCVNHYAAKQGKIWTRKLQPVGEPQVLNAYVSYGDRNFKVVIYNGDYKGVTIGDLSSLHYYPSEWTNAYLRRDQYDISGTSKDKPTGISTILLEETVNIKVLNYNGFEITKIEALDVPENAVSITKVDGEWQLVFSSNFYDNVVFKATDNNGGESYFQIKRYTIDGWIQGNNLVADFYFDRTKTYSDFEITAKILYKDGNVKNVKLTPHYGIDDGLGNITKAWEVDEENPEDEHMPKGKGLKKAFYEYELEENEDKKIKAVYLNVEYTGSTKTQYAGSYAGSGRGVLANIYHGEEE